MYGSFIILALATLTQLTGYTILLFAGYILRSACFEFFITRDLNKSEELEKSNWTTVKVTTADSSVSVTFDIPAALSYSDALIFFANDDKNILLVSLMSLKMVQGKFYEVPYRFKKEMKGGEITKTQNANFHRISGTFPQEWLPKKFNKVNAAVLGPDGEFYNYYKIQNFEISLPDLMVIEEYRNIKSDIDI